MIREVPIETLTHSMVLRVRHKFRQRVVEWLGATEIMLLGMVLMQEQSTFESSQSFTLMQSMASEASWAYILFIVGVSRLIGLIINGSMEAVTPWIRTVGALAGFSVFSLITISMLYSQYWLGNPPTTGVVMYGMAAFGEILAIFCAVVDARIYENGRRERSRTRNSGT